MRQEQLFTALFLAVKKYLKKTLIKNNKDVTANIEALLEQEISGAFNSLDEKITRDGREIAVELAVATKAQLNKGWEDLSYDLDARFRMEVPSYVSDEVEVQLKPQMDTLSSEVSKQVAQEVSEKLATKIEDIEWEQFYGRDGDDGLSTYELWLQDNEGSLEDFYSFIKGEKGDQGFSIDYVVDNYRLGFKREDETDYTFTDDLRGQDGKSVEVDVQGGRVGFRIEGNTQFNYTDNLRGEDGEKGKSLFFKVEDDTIGIRQEGTSEWTWTPTLTGSRGEDGKGLEYKIEGYKVGVRREGESEYSFTKSLRGTKGEKGEDGKSLKFKVDSDRIGIKQEGEHRYTYTESLIGDKPDHRWIGTQLQFEKPDGSWGKPVELRGPSGGGGRGGKGGTYTNTTPTTVSVGGVEAGTTFNNVDLSKLIEMIFYPVEFPTLVHPSLSFDGTNLGLQEIGSSVTVDFTAAFSRGSINPQYEAESPFRSGNPTGFFFSGQGLEDVVSEAKGVMAGDGNVVAGDARVLAGEETTIYPVVNQSVEVVVPDGTLTWTARTEYAEGVQPMDSKGNPFQTPLPAGSTNTISRSIIGVYPVFATTYSITSTTKQPLVQHNATVTVSMVTETATDKQVIEFPLDKWNQITKLEQYNTTFERWDKVSMASWAQSVTTKDINGIAVEYRRYTHTGSIVGARQLRWFT